jgi:hypothetical protein
MRRMLSVGVAWISACGFPRPADVPDEVATTGTPCTQTVCAAGQLAVCSASGFVDQLAPCALGCSADTTRCADVSPSNGLAGALDQARGLADVALQSGSSINTDTGVVVSGGTSLPVATSVVAQPGGPMLRVLIARGFDIQDTAVSGTLPLAIVASNDVVVRGTLDAAARGSTFGSGGTVCGAGAGRGGRTEGTYILPPANQTGGYPPHLWASNGFGGGGFGTAGGVGGSSTTAVLSGIAPGAPGIVNGTAALVPLRGGCEGGAYYEISGRAPGGAGGGAVQLVAGRSVHLVRAGAVVARINVGGGRGLAGVLGVQDINGPDPVWGPTGGGSGGGVLLEAPAVVIDDGVALLAGGGGGGGWGACAVAPDGRDEDPVTGVGTGGSCPATVFPRASGGDGATTADGSPGENDSAGAGGGGGGGLGRIRINTADGQYATGPTTLVRGAVTTGLVGRR